MTVVHSADQVIGSIPTEPVSGHDRHLLDSLLSNYMRVTVVREDTHDAVTLWNEAGDPIAHGAAPPISPLNVASGFAAGEGSSAPGGRVDDAPQSLEAVIAPVAAVLGQPVYSVSEAANAIIKAGGALSKATAVGAVGTSAASEPKVSA